mgnify:CR=1 FL=1|jgi:hypothetical protein
MNLLEKFKTPGFWNNVLKIAVPFLILVTVISLFMNSWRDIFAGDFAKVNEVNFADGKWKRFWGFKIVLSFVYGLYIAAKKTK